MLLYKAKNYSALCYYTYHTCVCCKYIKTLFNQKHFELIQEYTIENNGERNIKLIPK